MFNPDYLLFLITFAAIYALFSLGLNLHWGFTGLLNFGHAGFMAIGSYTTILLYWRFSLPIPLAMLVGGLAAALLGLVMGMTTLRLRQDYLAIVTIGVAELVRLVALNEEWLTGGSFGLQGFPLPLADFKPTLVTRYGMVVIFSAVVGLGAWQLGKHLWQTFKAPKAILLLPGTLGLYLYSICVNALLNFRQNPEQTGLMFLSILTLAIVFVALEKLVHSPWGRVLKAIREDEEVPRALGKNVFLYKLQSLMLGGFIAGIGAVFNVWQLSNVYPSEFQTSITFTTWTIVVLGGAGSNPGTLLGAVIFWTYNALTRDLGKVLPWLGADQVGALRVMLIGVILMSLMIWRPQGILGNKDELSLGK